MQSISTRVCTKCGETKPETAQFYSPCKRSTAGLHRTCRACRNAAERERRRQNPDRVREYRRTDRENNGDSIRARDMAYYWKNRDAQLAYKKRHYLENRATYIERARKWREENPKRSRELARQYARKNAHTRAYKHKRNAITRRYRGRKRNAPGTHTAQEFVAKVNAYNGRCHWCGEVIVGTPHADHLIALAKGGSNDIGNIVPSCPRCNFSKRDKMPWEFMEGRLL